MVKDSNNSNTDSDSHLARKFSRKEILFSRFKRKVLKHVYILRVLLIAAFIGILYLTFAGISNVSARSGLSEKITLAKRFIFPRDEVLKTTDSKTNILILGKGGSGHEAPDLTDSMILLSINKDKNNITQLSLPRDIWFPTLKIKLNSAYYWGNQKEAGGGLVLAKSSVEEIVGVPVHYAVVFDFSLFEEVIKILDGVDINVQTAFTDQKYPVAGREADTCNGDKTFACRYETISFEKGLQHMDAETALKFVRSRNAEGDEGTDLARSKRQQLVVDAVIAKASSKEFLLSPRKAFGVMDTILNSLETDMSKEQLATMGRYVFNARQSVQNVSIPEELIEHPTPTSEYDNLYVFIPASGDWNEVQNWYKGVLQ